MAKPTAKKNTTPTYTPPTNNNATKLLIGGIAGVILIGLIIALVVSLTGNEDESSSNLPDASPYQPVTVEGTPLAELSDSSQDAAIGTVAPTLTGQTFFGEPVSVAADGKAKVVMFMAHWCPHCQAELPLIIDWMKDNASKYDITYQAIATGTSAQRDNFPPADWFQEEGYTYPVMADDNKFSAAAAYGLGSYPYFVFLDGQNKVVSRTSGEISMSDFENYIQQAIAANTTSSTTTAAP